MSAGIGLAAPARPVAPAGERPSVVAPLTILYHHRTRSRDGQSVHIDALVDALRRQGHLVVMVGPQRVAATRAKLDKALLPRPVHELLELGYSLVEAVRLVRAIRRHRPDAIYERANIFMLSGITVARWFGLPLLLEVNAPLTAERRAFGGLALARLARWTEERAWRGAARVLPVTRVLGRMIEAAGVPAERIAVTPNGVDPAALAPRPGGPDRTSLGLGDALVLGFVGFVREWHGLEHVLDLMAADPALAGAHFLIVGDGPARPVLERRAAQLGLGDRMILTGVVERALLPGFIACMDIALQPEVTAYASPLKLFEYMALGRAVVAPDAENIREVLTHEADALLFAPGEPAAMAGAIRRLAGDPALRRALGERAAARIASGGYLWDSNAARVAGLIRSLKTRP